MTPLIAILPYFIIIGTNRIYLFGNIYRGMHHENHSVWLLATSYCVSTEYVEFVGFYYRHDRVRISNTVMESPKTLYQKYEYYLMNEEIMPI